MSADYGHIVEDYVRDIASNIGVADFVFRPATVAKGPSTREIGDGLLWVGHQMAIVSVKSREPRLTPDTPARRDSWLTKNIAKAVVQINGSYRHLTNATDLSLTSERGVSIPWKRELVDQFTGVVIVDHEDPWNYVPNTGKAAIPTVVLALGDWLTLHQRFPSTAAIVRYLQWRARNGLPNLPLAAEKDILASHHIAEEDLERGTPFEVRKGAWEQTWRDRPEIFFGTRPDHKYGLVVDNMIAGASDLDPDYSALNTPSDYLGVIEFLDRIALLPRIEFGKGVLKKCREAGDSGELTRMISVLPQGVIVFVADPAERSSRSRYLQSLTAARHSQIVEATGITDLTTLGIATEPIPTPGRSHDFVLIRATFHFTADEKIQRDELFGPLPPELPQLLLSRYEGYV